MENWLDRPLYYDFDGNPIDLLTWVNLSERKRAWRSVLPSGETTPDEDATRIGSTHVHDAWVSTVWVGLDMGFHPFADYPPIIFETMVFGGEHDQYQERYATKEQALAGHNRIVQALENNESPEG